MQQHGHTVRRGRRQRWYARCPSWIKTRGEVERGQFHDPYPEPPAIATAITVLPVVLWSRQLRGA